MSSTTSLRGAESLNRFSLPSLLSSTSSLLAAPSADDDQSMKDKAKVLAKDLTSHAKDEIGNWWSAKKENNIREPEMQRPHPPFFKRSASDGNSSYPRPLVGAPPVQLRPKPRVMVPPPAPLATDPFHSEATPILPVPASQPQRPPPGREHLFYRDQAPQTIYPPVVPRSYHEKRRYSNPGPGPSTKEEADDSISKAIELSKQEIVNDAAKAKREDAELQRALAESARLARQSASPDSVKQTSEYAELSRAILESQRQVLLDQRRRSVMAVPSSPSPRQESPPTLEESEWMILSRNKKGGLWSEGGAHGWLPPGAGRPGGLSEEEGEHRMLEMAIRISLEEEKERKVAEQEGVREDNDRIVIPNPWGSIRRNSSASSISASTGHSQSPRRLSKPRPRAPLSPAPLSPVSSLQRSRSLSERPPTRPLPPIPTDFDENTSPPFPSDPDTSLLRRRKSSDLSFRDPPFNNEDQPQGSPLEMPFLTSTHSHQDGMVSPLPERRHTTEVQDSFEVHSPELNASSGGTRTSSSLSHLDVANRASTSTTSTSAENLAIRNPDFAEQGSWGPVVDEPEDLPGDSEGRFGTHWTGRSMSLISEHTEPGGSGSSKLARCNDDGERERTAVEIYRELEREKRGQQNGTNEGHDGRDQRSTQRSTPYDLPITPPYSPSPLREPSPPLTINLPSDEPLGSLPNIPDDIQDLEGHSEAVAGISTPSSPVGDRRAIFGDGVQFGFPSDCAREHACAMDGLHSEPPFPDRVVLSTGVTGNEGVESDEREKKTFAVEARTWVSLLRFLMWYGETQIVASPDDVGAEETGHCDAAMSLEFRKDDEGSGVVRLTITLLPPNHPALPQTLTLSDSTPAPGKGKGRARSTPITPSIFSLPDHPVLPTRLSTIAVSLYSLRHLGEIALSTQPSKDAVPSYHTLRTLALSLQSLAREHDKSKDDTLTRARTQKDDERLLGRLRDRLKRMKPGSAGNTGGAKSMKVPPAAQAERTHAVPRQERVLTQGEGDSLSELRYLPTLAKV